MELALSSTNQLLRRAGKRFIVAKLSNPSQKTESQTDKIPSSSFIRVNSNGCYCNYSRHGFTITSERNINMFLDILKPNKPCTLLSKVRPFSKSLHIPCRQMHTIVKTDWIDELEIEEVLSQSGQGYKRRHTGLVTVCPRCSSLKNNDQKLYKLFVNTKTGDSICRSCGHQQSWKELKKNLTAINEPTNDTLKPVDHHILESNSKLNNLWSQSVEITCDDNKLIHSIFPSLANTHIDILRKFNIRKYNDSLLFPFYDITNRHLVSLKVFSSKEVRTILKEGDQPTSLFGWNTIQDTDNKLNLTSSEVDCLAISQATGSPTLSLPLGASTLPPECLAYLEQFDEITFWLCDEYQARQNLHRFAAKLDLSRCSFVNSIQNASELLVHGYDAILSALQKKQLMSHDHIVTFKDLRSEVFSDLIHAKRNAGIPFVRFPSLNEYLKGHRRGELTVFTGPTGSGKTTFLSELSIDLCTQGVRTLWGSFEIKNNRLANTMMHQFSGLKLENYLENFHFWCDEFENLPMYFMNYYGATDLKQVLETIQYSVYTYDIEHVIIDNLQFMTSIDRGEDKFQLMDRSISSFRRCASDLNIHITVVVHPRKENDGTALQTASIYGSAKASQEADNVLILQNTENLAMQVSKNRYNGAVGTIPLSFHPDSLCLSGFHRNVDTNEAILPMLKVRRPVQNIKVVRKVKPENN